MSSRSCQAQGCGTEFWLPVLCAQVDGGVTQGNVGRAVLAGANIFVAGTSVFSHKSGAAAGVAQMLSAMHARV